MERFHLQKLLKVARVVLMRKFRTVCQPGRAVGQLARKLWAILGALMFHQCALRMGVVKMPWPQPLAAAHVELVFPHSAISSSVTRVDVQVAGQICLVLGTCRASGILRGLSKHPMADSGWRIGS